jgi:2-haloalkanoic acid dehalogenase type II
MFAGLQPIISRLPPSHPYHHNRTLALAEFHKTEQHFQVTQPRMIYSKLLTEAYTAFALSLSLPSPSASEAEHFGASIGTWAAHPDTVAALKSLKKRYKLVFLSNIDNETIARTIKGPLEGVEIDAVYTAQNIGSYKPDLNNFHYLLEGVKKEFGVEKDELLHIAQALQVDLGPVRKMGLQGAWIDREEEDERAERIKDEVDFTWRFETLEKMAEAVEEAFGKQIRASCE